MLGSLVCTCLSPRKCVVCHATICRRSLRTINCSWQLLQQQWQDEHDEIIRVHAGAVDCFKLSFDRGRLFLWPTRVMAAMSMYLYENMQVRITVMVTESLF
jgi:hypothetical protein